MVKLSWSTLVNVDLFSEISDLQNSPELWLSATRAKKREVVLELYEPIKRGEI